MYLQIAGGEKGDQDTDNKNQNVKNGEILSAYTGISKESRYNEKHAKQNSDDTWSEKLPGGLKQNNDFKQSIKKCREEKQL